MTTNTTTTTTTTTTTDRSLDLDELDLEGFAHRLINGRSMSYLDDHGVWRYTDDPVALLLPMAERAYIEQAPAHVNQATPMPPSLRNAAAMAPCQDWFRRHSGYLYDTPERAERNAYRRRWHVATRIVDRWVERIAGPVPPGGYPDHAPYRQLATTYLPHGWRLTAEDDLELAAKVYGQPLDEAEIALLSDRIVDVVVGYIGC